MNYDHAMDHDQPRLRIELLAGQLLSLDHYRKTRVECVRGQLWVTEATDTRDALLKSGESFVANADGLVLVEALRDSVLCVGEAARVTRSPEGGFSSGLPSWLRAIVLTGAPSKARAWLRRTQPFLRCQSSGVKVFIDSA